MPKFSNELAAAVLVEAAYMTDERACDRFGVSLRSLQRWRKALATDDVLASCVATKKAALDAKWADDLTTPIRAAARFITDAALNADANSKRNPEFVHAIVGALKVCADVHLTSKVLDVRIAQSTGTRSGLFGDEPSDADSYAN